MTQITCSHLFLNQHQEGQNILPVMFASPMFADIRTMVKVRCCWFSQGHKRAHWNKHRFFYLFSRWLSPFYHFQLILLSFGLSYLTSSFDSTHLTLPSWKLPYSILIKHCTSKSDPIANPASRGGVSRDLLILFNLNFHTILWRDQVFLQYIVFIPIGKFINQTLYQVALVYYTVIISPLQ